MEQRPLRLGDIVDDYCPRERRVTNHAIVAIVNDSIRQTRCSACDTEHVFRGGKPPRRRTKDGVSAATDNAGGQLVTPTRAGELEHEGDERIVVSEAVVEVAMEASPQAVDQTTAEPEPASDAGAVQERSDDIWPANRQLIRATLPRVEGEMPPPRPIPEFTMHQRYSGRGAAAFRQARNWADQGFGSGRNMNGGRDRRQGQGFGDGNANGNVNGNGAGHGGGHGHGRRRRHKKRPR